MTCHFLRRSVGDDSAAFAAGFGADINDAVGFSHDVEVVLDDDDGVAIIHQTVEDIKPCDADGMEENLQMI